MIHTTSPGRYYFWRVVLWSLISLGGWAEGFAHVRTDHIGGVALCGVGFIAMWIVAHFVNLWLESGHHD